MEHEEVNIIKYLPPVLQEVKEFKAIANAENPQIQRLWQSIDNGLKDQFVNDSTLRGVKRMEAILSISPKGTENLETRKSRILARLNDLLPYTFRRLERWLLGVCGDDKFSLSLSPEIYQLTIRLWFYDITRLMEIYNQARCMSPANMVIRQMVASEMPIASAIVGIHSSIAIYAHVEPYQAGSHEGRSTAAMGVFTTMGITAVLE